MLGKNESDLRKLKSGRSAFWDGSISDVYDILQEESDAMKRYFSLMKDDTAFREFIEADWSVRNPGSDLLDMEQIKAKMERII